MSKVTANIHVLADQQLQCWLPSRLRCSAVGYAGRLAVTSCHLVT